MRVVTGDLVRMAGEGVFGVVVHGCNCQCVMGKGIAAAIREAFPEAYAADLRTGKGDRGKLGTVSTAAVERAGVRVTVVNAYTQFHWRGKGVLADYEAIRAAFREVKRRFAGERIGYPKIGAGLAGGDWERIAGIIEEELAGEEHVLVVLGGGSPRRHGGTKEGEKE
jgi:O-acetyl-ADP-ribose deacetylase (regulator of RNase III)